MLVREHGGDSTKRMRIIAGVEARVKEKHEGGHTAGDPGLLRRKVMQVVDRHLKGYRKLRGDVRNGEVSVVEEVRREAKDSDDGRRMEAIRQLRPKQLADALKEMGLSVQTAEFLGRWLETAQKQNGRVAVKRRSKGKGGVTLIELAGSERRYRRMAKEIEAFGVWRILSEHSHTARRCRQITLNDRVLKLIRKRKICKHADTKQALVPANEDEQKAHLETIRVNPDSDHMA